MNLTNEQIREFFENPEKLKETFPEVFNKMKVGRWYKYISKSGHVCLFTPKGEYDMVYGFFKGKWTYSNWSFPWIKEIVKATKQEVEEALQSEIRKRYKKGDVVKCLLDGGRTTLNGSFNNGANDENEQWGNGYPSNALLYLDGKWAEIVEQPTTYSDLESNILQWAEEKGILDKATPMTQALKTLEEVNELLTAINNDNKGEIEDALGDILVTLIIGAKLNGLKLTECLQSAYLEIKDRKGKMINGTFVKE